MCAAAGARSAAAGRTGSSPPWPPQTAATTVSCTAARSASAIAASRWVASATDGARWDGVHAGRGCRWRERSDRCAKGRRPASERAVRRLATRHARPGGRSASGRQASSRGIGGSGAEADSTSSSGRACGAPRPASRPAKGQVAAPWVDARAPDSSMSVRPRAARSRQRLAVAAKVDQRRRRPQVGTGQVQRQLQPARRGQLESSRRRFGTSGARSRKHLGAGLVIPAA